MTPAGQALFSAAFIVSNHVLAGAFGARISTTSDGSWKQKSEILKYLLFSFQQALTAKMPPAILWIFALKAQVAPIIEALPFSPPAKNCQKPILQLVRIWDCHVEPGRDIRIVPEPAFRSQPDFSTALRSARNDTGGAALCSK